MTPVAMRPRPETTSLPKAAQQLDISRGLAYKLAKTDQFPVRLIRAGRKILVPTAELNRVLGIEE